MIFRHMIAVVAAIVWASSAVAQEACPAPDMLRGEAVSIADLFAGLQARTMEKGEFETTAAFEARRDAAGDPPPVLIQVDLEPRGVLGDVDPRVTYDADREVFRLFVPILGASGAYADAFRLRPLADVLAGEGFWTPVDLSARVELLGGDLYAAENAFGATTVVTHERWRRYVVFDNKGRHRRPGDDLFSMRDAYEASYLEIPVPLAQAVEVKSRLSIVALIDPRQPLTAIAERRSQPTRSRPREEDNEYRIVFADILCIGARDGGGDLLAHWKTR